MRIIGLIHVGYSWEGIWERNFAGKTLARRPIILYMNNFVYDREAKTE